MLWDIFCKVIDNHGDLGVCWRLSADLATRGETVRLWVDDPSALAWMAPASVAGVSVVRWSPGIKHPPGEVIVEAFGCDPEPTFLQKVADEAAQGSRVPVWINLEYLSAEPYVERCHGLASRVNSGLLAGFTKWFFYPGFTPATGGLLREPDLAKRHADFDRTAARHALGATADQRLINLFCYEPVALTPWLGSLAEDAAKSSLLLVAPGRPRTVIEQIFEHESDLYGIFQMRNQLSISYQYSVLQTRFDEHLWAADLNCVRGEDSLVRALWAGRALVWQIYPQADDAHVLKLEAFLDWLDAPADLRQFHRVWNGTAAGTLPAMDLPAWTACVQAARTRLLAQTDLSTQLIGFVTGKQ
jgi:uncharacterized repeat protein (TIGR03837 family)